MKTKLVVGVILALGLGIIVWTRAQLNKQPAGPTATSDGTKTVAVDAVAKDPNAHAGPIAIEGIVAKVLADRGAILLIDKAEFAACGTTDCAEYAVPLMVPKDQFEGELPKVKETVIAVGDLQPAEKGYSFLVQEVKREGKSIMRRTSPPTTTQHASAIDFLPGTLVAQKEVLGLTDEQVKKLTAAQAAFSEVEQQLQEKINHCQAELVELLEKKPVDQAKVDHEKHEIEEFKEKMAEERKKAEQSARSVLTAEQLKKLPK